MPNHPRRRKSDQEANPRVEKTEDGELVVLTSVRSTLRLMGVVMFFVLAVVASGSVVVSNLSDEAHAASEAAGEARDAASEARDTAREAREAAARTQVLLEEAIESVGSPNPAITEALEAVARVEAMLKEEFGSG